MSDLVLDKYIIEMELAKQQLGYIETLLDNHQSSVHPDEVHWGHVGSIATVTEKLKEVLEQLGAR